MPVSPARPGPNQVDVSKVSSRFNLAFGLMSIIPLLTCVYVVTVRLFSVSILEGLNGIYFLLALAIALLGLLVGQQLIRDMFRRLVDANAKLERLNDQQAAFVSNVSHEFRSPLAVFKGAMDNLVDGLRGPLQPDQLEPLGMCQKEVGRLTRLVRDLLDITRLEAGKLPLIKEEVVLQEVLRSVGQVCDALAKNRGLSLTMDLPEAPLRVTGDKDRLQQVFINLLSNAAKYTDAGSISVRLTSEPETAQISVIDTGRGIDAKDLERIFDKFERVGLHTEEGAGLGLPIAKDIVELHQGQLWAESQPGRGSRFIVRLPLQRRGPA